MDRLEFSESVGVDPEIQLRRHFDEVMGMYNLFGEFENISIKGSVKEESISFDLLFKDQKEAKELGTAIDGNNIIIYGLLYTIHSICTNKIINVSLEHMKQ